MERKSVALVLGCGAARGFAHIGVIDALEESGYDIVSIAGCSIGSVVGGAYAAGRLSEFREWACSLDKLDVFRLLDLSFRSAGSIRGDRLFQQVKSLIGNPSIEHLRIPFTAVATDLLRQKEFWFQKGSLIDAMRASSAIPSVVVPVSLNGRVYVDGGLLNPLPIIPTVSASADLILAVDLNGTTDSLTIKDLMPPAEEEGANLVSLAERFFNVRKKDGSSSKPESKKTEVKKSDKPGPERWGRLQMMNVMFETMQESLTQYKIAGYPPDKLVSVPKDLCAFYEFWRAQEMIDYGYRAAMHVLNDSSKANWQV